MKAPQTSVLEYRSRMRDGSGNKLLIAPYRRTKHPQAKTCTPYNFGPNASPTAH